jgi:predicted nuclease of restriction endonuclease-like (RecB) superfamily
MGKSKDKNGIILTSIEQELFDGISAILERARSNAFVAVNFAMVEAYWDIGKFIIEKQGGEERAKYGDGLLKNISKKLTEKFGKGFSTPNLFNMRQFYLTFGKFYTACRELSWSHCRLIMRVENEQARNFYIEEAAKGRWSVRQLERQINSFVYERLLSSKDKNGVLEEIIDKEPNTQLLDTVKDPYVLEFMGLDPKIKYYESDIEQALIEHLQSFLLELGRGFTFESRQKRISFDGRHFYIDLVFYNYKTKSFVLIDLKTGDLTHQDIGQMQMYVNYYTREMMNEGDNPPIGIILCADKSDAIVKYTFPDGGNPQIFASKYMLHMPTEEELIREIQGSKDIIMREKKLLDNKKDEE